MTNPLSDIPPDDIVRAYRERRLERLSDTALLGHVCNGLHTPKSRTTSFTLHAPLEALTRYNLLSFVAPETREAARMRLVQIAADYEAMGDSVGPAPLYTGPTSVTGAVSALREAIDGGDIETADGAVAWLARRADPGPLLAAFTDFAFDHLGAAAHVPIYLYLAARSGPAAAGLSLHTTRVYARQLAFETDARIRTPTHDAEAMTDATDETVEAAYRQALAAPPRLESASFNGIAPLVQDTEAAGLPARVLAGLWRGAAATPDAWSAALRATVRVAAHAMLQDTQAHAKLGWTHCLTIPQAVWAIGPMIRDPLAAVRFASVLTLAFRAGLGQRDLSETPALPHPSQDIGEALRADPLAAAAAAYHTDEDAVPSLRTVLATGAAVRADTHLNKFVLATLDSAAMDPAAAPIYHAAAAYLLSIWIQADESDALLAAFDAAGLRRGA